MIEFVPKTEKQLNEERWQREKSAIEQDFAQRGLRIEIWDKLAQIEQLIREIKQLIPKVK